MTARRTMAKPEISRTEKTKDTSDDDFDDFTRGALAMNIIDRAVNDQPESTATTPVTEEIVEAASCTSQSSSKKTVSFSVIKIDEHPIILSDNPGGFLGPPLGIDWETQATYEFTVEDYEAGLTMRRTMHEMNLNSSARVEILRRNGYSREEITYLTKSVNQTRIYRRATVDSMRFEGVYELKEKVLRGVLDIFTLGRRTRRERSLLRQCRLIDEQNASNKKRHNDSFRTSALTEEDEDRMMSTSQFMQN